MPVPAALLGLSLVAFGIADGRAADVDLAAPLRQDAAGDTLPRMRARCTELSRLPNPPGDWAAVPALAGYPATSASGHRVLAAAWEAPWAARDALHNTAPMDLVVDAGGATHALIPLRNARSADVVMKAVMPGAIGAPGGPWMMDVGGEPIRVRVEERENVHYIDIRSPGVAPDHAPTEGLGLMLGGLPKASGCLVFARSPVVHAGATPGGPDEEELRLLLMPHGPSTPAIWRQLAPGQGAQPGTIAPTAPKTGRAPSSVQLVMVSPSEATGQPWLQRSQLPHRLGIVGALVPSRSGLVLEPGVTLATFKGSSSAATLMVLPVRTKSGEIPGSIDILRSVARSGGRSTSELRAAPGGHLLPFGAGLELGASPGVLVLGTDPALVAEVLANTGTPWFDGATAAQLGRGVVGWVEGRPEIGGGTAHVRVAAGFLEVQARSDRAEARATTLVDALVGWLGLVDPADRPMPDTGRVVGGGE